MLSLCLSLGPPPPWHWLRRINGLLFLEGAISTICIIYVLRDERKWKSFCISKTQSQHDNSWPVLTVSQPDRPSLDRDTIVGRAHWKSFHRWRHYLKLQNSSQFHLHVRWQELHDATLKFCNECTKGRVIPSKRGHDSVYLLNIVASFPCATCVLCDAGHNTVLMSTLWCK